MVPARHARESAVGVGVMARERSEGKPSGSWFVLRPKRWHVAGWTITARLFVRPPEQTLQNAAEVRAYPFIPWLIKHPQRLFSDVLQVESQVHENLRRHSFLFSQQSEEQMFCADVVVIESPGLLDRELDDLLGVRRVWELSQDELVPTGSSLDDFLHL